MSENAEEYRAKMQRQKQAVDRRIARADRDKGLLLVLTGPGKGKSSSAFGMVARSLGHGMRCAIVSFIKGTYDTGEEAFFRRTPGVEMHVMGEGFTWETQDQERDRQAASRAWRTAEALLSDPKIDLVVLDELCIAIRKEMVAFEEVVSALRGRPDKQHVVITGRGAPAELIEMADTVSEIRPVKHAFQQGIRAQRGIEL